MINKGFSIVEMLVAVSILVIIAALSVSVFSRISNGSSLEKESQIILSMVTKARTESINSVNDTTHGIKFTGSSVALFRGTTYSVSNVESVYNLQSTTLSNISLTGGVSELYFKKLTGNPSASGSVTVSTGDTSKIMTIYGTGLAEIQ